ncbi:mechanosensitive ion channel family protein [Spongiivirga citrea]|uniref:Mechanosensitive ion channel n=1 Tax=Spongiivirga citrea TaxID=1481457 RepID=A0A6M0CKX4_9FLAO|nr:mechanosensitive ion channel domain-containing protein [Spongiivirga citrea]NER18558.1 mechanosensitive ion channel [Spongiivirga citrea]
MTQDNAQHTIQETTSTWDKVVDLLSYQIDITEKVHITILQILIVLLVFILTSYLLKLIRRLVTRKLPEEDKLKFVSFFSFIKYFIYIVVILVTLDNTGFNVTAIFAASAALLVGIGLALQTLFQDIISGVFILLDQTVHVGDIIEIDGKVGRVEKINLRTTRAVTIDNKVLIIPNHKYLTSILYNWTENGSLTRENIEVGVAYGSDTELVKNILLEVALAHPKVRKKPEPLVLLTNFGDSALNFKLIFSMNDSFIAGIPKSDMRFEIDKRFREHNISIPFPQREVRVYQADETSLDQNKSE